MVENRNNAPSIETIHLGFDPSDSLRDVFKDFHNNDSQQFVDDMVFESTVSFPVSVYNGLVRPHPYHVEDQELPTLSSRMSDYKHSLARIAQNRFALSPTIAAKRSKENGALIHFARIIVPPAQMLRISSLAELGLRPAYGSLEIHTGIPYGYLEKSERLRENGQRLLDLVRVADAVDDPVALYLGNPHLIRHGSDSDVHDDNNGELEKKRVLN